LGGNLGAIGRMLWGTALMVTSIPTFALGFANAPGFALWRRGCAKNSAFLRSVGGLTSWLAQTYLSLAWGILLISIGRIILGGIPLLIRLVLWLVILYLALLPIFSAWKVIIRDPHERDLNDLTIPLAAVTTFVVVIVVLALPRAAIPLWSWVPLARRGAAVATP
jgi:hypothetical protein